MPNKFKALIITGSILSAMLIGVGVLLAAGWIGKSLPAKGTISIPGPGTGLGVAQLWRDGTGSYHVQATEGGHIDFAPLDAIEDALLARLRKRHRRVSVETVSA